MEAVQFEGQQSMKRLYSEEGLTAPKPAGESPARPPEDFTNSADQDKAAAEIEEWLLSDALCHSLIGAAGTGKSTLMKQVLASAKKKRWSVMLSAPTHQAAARLREAAGYGAETTHRLLGVSLVRDKKTGKQGLVAKGTPNIGPRTLIVIDEASMNPDQLLNIVVNFAEKTDCKVLFVGDAAQLNPVKEKPSKTVDRETCEWEISELTTIHRQAAENPIILAATAVRLADPKNLPTFETNMVDGKGVMVVKDKREWADMMISQCSDDEFAHRYIAYTNRATDEAAKAIRLHKYGAEASKSPYLPGELLVVNSRCTPPDDDGKSRSKKKRGEQVVIQANDLVTVETAWRDGDYYHVLCDWHGFKVTLKAFENYMQRTRHLESLRKVAIQNSDWEKYFDDSDSIADLRSATSITAHSSQGSTFDNVFINLNNIKTCRNYEERQRLLYVAITRASGAVYLYGDRL